MTVTTGDPGEDLRRECALYLVRECGLPEEQPTLRAIAVMLYDVPGDLMAFCRRVAASFLASLADKGWEPSVQGLHCQVRFTKKDMDREAEQDRARARSSGTPVGSDPAQWQQRPREELVARLAELRAERALLEQQLAALESKWVRDSTSWTSEDEAEKNRLPAAIRTVCRKIQPLCNHLERG